MKSIFKNLEFAQMQGAGKICEHPLCGLPAYPTSPRRIYIICEQEIFCEHPLRGLPAYPASVTQQLRYNEVAVKANL